MSRLNKVNPDHYTMAGRLTADDLARERMRQGEHRLAGARRGRKKPIPPWMADEQKESGAAEAPGEREDAGMPKRQLSRKQGAAASRKGSRPAPTQKATGEAPGRSVRQSTKSSGARGTPRTRKAPSARGTAARGASPQRVRKPAARKGRTKGSGTKRKTQAKK